MKILKFNCELLSDVILNQHAASEGTSRTLDFIPGSNFLGIVAGRLYGECTNAPEAHQLEMLDLFHSGKVRFGDAHLAAAGIRGLKIPAALFYPKLGSMSAQCYVHHLIPDPSSPELRQLQLKQCRSGFYAFSGPSATRLESETSCAIKSAYDKDRRCAKDTQLYVYESLRKGGNLLFEIEIDEDSRMNTPENIRRITDALCGKKRIGRSRTAQFGLVNITAVSDFHNAESAADGCKVLVGGEPADCITVYADGRLIFLDDYGMPTFQPTAAQLGLPADAEILWDKSQIRTFQYAPWNYKRQCFDTDRCGIEKGSVFVVRTPHSPDTSRYVGAYRNEGFGKVIYNPDFLKASAQGEALVAFKQESRVQPDATLAEKSRALLNADNDLLQYLGSQLEEERVELEICKEVNAWVHSYSRFFRGDTFASQWGTVRKLAMLYNNEEDLVYHLYGACTGKYSGCTSETALQCGYLTHGVAAEKWKEKNRIDKLKEFCEHFSGNLQKAIINLASEMAKQCR